MNDYTSTPYNIEDPTPLHAGSYKELVFEVFDPFSNTIPNLTFANNITFTMTLYGGYNSEIVLKFTKRDTIGGLPRIQINDVQKNLLTIFLYSTDTLDFEDGFYDFQITLNSISGLEDSVIGQGKIKIYKKIK